MKKKRWISDDGAVELYCGDCLDVLPTLAPQVVSAVVTSPPYAEQRKRQYGGIPERRYPLFTANWAIALEQSLCQDASLLINIREHVRDGVASDYVHKTRSLLRDVGFVECDELIWIKAGSPPFGNPARPRRSWERVLWFATSSSPFCDPKANGNESDRLFGPTGRPTLSWSHGAPGDKKSGRSRHRDYVECGTQRNSPGVSHPAKFPTAFAAWLVRGWSRPGAVVCDPFLGSGSTGVAAVETGRRFIGIEKHPGYFAMAVERIREAIKREASRAAACAA